MKEVLPYKHIIFLIFLIGILYLLFPTTYMMAGRDPGLYFLNGIHISKTGAYQYETDLVLTENYDAEVGLPSPGYPGLYSDYDYGYSDNPGDITPQFMPAFASTLAMGYDLGGISGLIRVNGIITILSFLMMYFFLKRNISEKVACISICLLAVSPAQLWYGRNSVSEILLQLIIILSVDIYAQGYSQNMKRNAVIAGGLIGLGVMVRIDAYILGVAIIAMLIYSMTCSKQHNAYTFSSVLTYVFCGSGAFIYGMIFSKQYFYDHMKNLGSLSKVLMLNLGMLMIALLVFLICMLTKSKNDKNYLVELFNNKKATVIIMCLLLGVWGYAYYFRSLRVKVDETTYFIKHSIVELSWYVSVLCMVLAIIGLVGLLYKQADKYENIFLFFAIGLSNYIGYGINPYISKDHIWASRRWVTIIIPFIVIMAVVGIRYLYIWFRKRRAFAGRIICICMIISIFCFYIYQSKAFLFVRIMYNIDNQIAQLSQQLTDDEIYFVGEGAIASYLKYVYDKNAYYFDWKEYRSIQQWLDEGKVIYYIGSEDSLGGADCVKEEIYTYEIKGCFLEQTVGCYPRELYERSYECNIYRLSKISVE
ncbi:MAG: glycosyltransferase family 39 protein [Lachnospiraceae bacterium]|nr:glycosyltransferase family 39 protein [Lachnospiraceae bacterium]